MKGELVNLLKMFVLLFCLYSLPLLSMDTPSDTNSKFQELQNRSKALRKTIVLNQLAKAFIDMFILIERDNQLIREIDEMTLKQNELMKLAERLHAPAIKLALDHKKTSAEVKDIFKPVHEACNASFAIEEDLTSARARRTISIKKIKDLLPVQQNLMNINTYITDHLELPDDKLEELEASLEAAKMIMQ